jgi:hypothetical protein
MAPFFFSVTAASRVRTRDAQRDATTGHLARTTARSRIPLAESSARLRGKHAVATTSGV